MRLIAERQLYGSYGLVHAGQQFEVADDIGTELLRRGLVHRADPPRIAYELHAGKFIPGPDWPAAESEKGKLKWKNSTETSGKS